jgi:hypothetical protein
MRRRQQLGFDGEPPRVSAEGNEKEAEFERRGVMTSVGVFRVKRVMGF